MKCKNKLMFIHRGSQNPLLHTSVGINLLGGEPRDYKPKDDALVQYAYIYIYICM